MPNRRRDVHWEVSEERDRQVNVHGWNDAHDDAHTPAEWSWLLGLRTNQLLAPTLTWSDARRALIELAAIAEAAVDSLDRQGEAWLGDRRPAGTARPIDAANLTPSAAQMVADMLNRALMVVGQPAASFYLDLAEQWRLLAELKTEVTP